MSVQKPHKTGHKRKISALDAEGEQARQIKLALDQVYSILDDASLGGVIEVNGIKETVSSTLNSIRELDAFREKYPEKHVSASSTTANSLIDLALTQFCNF